MTKKNSKNHTWIDVYHFRASFHCLKHVWAMIYPCYGHPPILINRIVLGLFLSFGVVKQNTHDKVSQTMNFFIGFDLFLTFGVEWAEVMKSIVCFAYRLFF